MDLQYCVDNDFKKWPPQDLAFLDRKPGVTIYNQVNFVSWMQESFEIDDEGWVTGVKIEDHPLYPGNDILLELDKTYKQDIHYVIIPGDTVNIRAFLGLHICSKAKRFKYLPAPKNNIIFWRDRDRTENTVIDKEMLCQIHLLKELPRPISGGISHQTLIPRSARRQSESLDDKLTRGKGVKYQGKKKEEIFVDEEDASPGAGKIREI